MSALVYVREQLGDGCIPRFDGTRCRVDPGSLWYRRNEQVDVAVEAALRCTEAGLPVTVVAIGPERVEWLLTHYLAAGATAAVRVWSPDLDHVELDDSLAALLLKGVIEQLRPDWIWLGDDDHGAVAVHLAELTGRVLAISVVDVTGHGHELELDRRLDRMTESVRLTAPGIIAVKRGAALRYPSHRDRLAVRQQAVTVLDAGAVLDRIPQGRRPTVTAITPPKPPTTRRRELGRADDRVAELILGATGGGHSQVVEDTVPNMARLAVATILHRVNSTTPTNPTTGDTP